MPASLTRERKDYVAGDYTATIAYYPDTSGMDVSNLEHFVLKVLGDDQTLTLQLEEKAPTDDTFRTMVGYAIAAASFTTNAWNSIFTDIPCKLIRLKMTHGGVAPTNTYVIFQGRRAK
jgi:hypothetical protein